jgi:OmpA-OmpF porin, OOP family
MNIVRSAMAGIPAVLMLIALCAPGALAENRPGDVTAGVFLGQLYLSNDLDYSSASILGMSLGYNVDGALSAELAIGYSNTKEETVPGAASDAAVVLYRLEGLYHLYGLLNEPRLVPFVATGLGALTFRSDRPGTDTDHDFIADAGVGVKYFINDGMALRGDFREIVDLEDVHELTYNSMISGSFMLSFGQPRKVEPVEPPEIEQEAAAPMPVEPPADTDGDGVPDSVDKCPGTLPGVKVDKHGCPEVKEVPKPVDGDGDSDGVPDSSDRCPNTPKGVKVDANGCPEPEKAVVTPRGTYDFGAIHFAFGKSTINRGSYPLLNNVAEHLRKYPDVKLEIQGHTDSIGSAVYNRKLSADRAAAVKNYLAGKGIAPGRLTAKGYGMSSPIASNKTKAGRAKNRRTEFMPIW